MQQATVSGVLSSRLLSTEKIQFLRRMKSKPIKHTSSKLVNPFVKLIDRLASIVCHRVGDINEEYYVPC